MSKYWFIPVGLVILVLAGFALIRTQYNNSKYNKTAADNNVITSGVSSPTLSVPGRTTMQSIPLSISEPANGATVTNSQILVRGKTRANAEVFINDKDTTADDGGSFSATLTLDEGENLIIVTANDADGNAAEQEFTVTYNAPE